MAKSFEEKLNRELTREKPETVKDENLKLFQYFFDTVDMIDVEKSPTALPNEVAFLIESVPVDVSVKIGDDLDVPPNLDLSQVNVEQLKSVSVWTKTVEGKEAVKRWQLFRDKIAKNIDRHPEKGDHLMDL